jgi:Putative transposase/Transposase zinc-binding domain
MGALQELFRVHGPAYLARYGDSMPGHQKKVLRALMACRTSANGSTCYHCPACGNPHVVPRCCGNRHCPACQGHKGYEWLRCQLERQLPTPYFMLTFTVPESLRAFLRSNQRLGYAGLFEASSGAIKTLCANPQFALADTPGFFGVLHTWGRELQFHPHIHYLVPGGALSGADGTWHSASAGFYLPVRALSRVYRARFRDLIAQAGLLDSVPPEVWSVDWNVNAQAVGEAANSLAYLARYVFKVAISESRIKSVDQTHVSFTYRKVHSNRTRTLRLPIFAFVHRFLQHVLPTGFMKLRYFGFLSPSFKMRLNEIRARVELTRGFDVRPPAAIEVAKPQRLRCPHCGAELIYRRTILPEAGPRIRIAAMIDHSLEQAMSKVLDSGP